MNTCKTLQTALTDNFYFASGSITGRRHLGSGNLLAGKNNQDSYGYAVHNDSLILSVHDGCGSTPHSEFGARLAAAITPLAIARTIDKLGVEKIETRQFLEVLKSELLKRILQVASVCTDVMLYPVDYRLPGDADDLPCALLEFIRKHMLFTILAAVVTEKRTVVFGMGDGVFFLNGRTHKIGPFIDNAPDYLSKTFIDPRHAPSFVLHAAMDTADLETLVLGTDGVVDLIDSFRKNLPGKKRIVGDFEKMFQEHCLFSHLQTVEHNQVESLTGWLRQANSEVVHLAEDLEGNAVLQRFEGLLPDDTTLLALRRVSAGD